MDHTPSFATQLYLTRLFHLLCVLLPSCLNFLQFINSDNTNALTAGYYYPLDFDGWCDSPFIDWTTDHGTFDVAELSDYQRIIPKNNGV